MNTQSPLLKEFSGPQNQLIQILINSLPDCIYVKDAQSRMVLSNQAHLQTLGASRPEEVAGKTDFDFFPTNVAGQFYSDEQTLMKSGQPLEKEEVVVDPRTKQVRWLQTSKIPLKDDAGNVVGLVGISRNVTERKQAEEKLLKTHADLEQRLIARTRELTEQNEAMQHQIAERERAEKAYAVERDLLHAIMDNIPDSVYFKDLKSRFLRTSRAQITKFHLENPEDAIGKSDFDFFSSEHAQRAFDDEQNIIHSGEPVIGLVEKETWPDGSVTWVSTTKMPLRNNKDEIIGTFGISRNITSLKKVEEELARERDLLRALMDNIPDAIYFKDLQSRFIRCTRSQCGTFHVENTDQLIGKSDFDFFTAEHAQRAFDDEQKIIRTGQPIIGLVEKETWPDGSVTWVSTTKMPLRSEKGEVIGTFGISRDITSLKRAEAENERIHQQLMVASRQAGMAEVATSVLHNVGNVLNSVNVSASLISETIRNSRAQAIQKIFALLRDNESQLGPFFSQHDKGKLVMSYLDGLTKQVAQERQQLLDEIGSLTKDVEHIKEIVAMQQNYAQVSGVVEKTKASDLVEDALRLNHESLVRHDVELVRQFDVDPEMLVEKHKVLQILVNLIRNAKQACKAAGRTHKHLTVSITQGDSGKVRLGVTDNGIGIPEENLTKIFMQGFTTRKGGHGFGLHGSANLAKEMNGALTAQSDGFDKGATFTLELPLQPPAKS